MALDALLVKLGCRAGLLSLWREFAEFAALFPALKGIAERPTEDNFGEPLDRSPQAARRVVWLRVKG